MNVAIVPPSECPVRKTLSSSTHQFSAMSPGTLARSATWSTTEGVPVVGVGDDVASLEGGLGEGEEVLRGFGVPGGKRVDDDQRVRARGFVAGGDPHVDRAAPGGRGADDALGRTRLRSRLAVHVRRTLAGRGFRAAGRRTGLRPTARRRRDRGRVAALGRGAAAARGPAGRRVPRIGPARQGAQTGDDRGQAAEIPRSACKHDADTPPAADGYTVSGPGRACAAA